MLCFLYSLYFAFVVCKAYLHLTDDGAMVVYGNGIKLVNIDRHSSIAVIAFPTLNLYFVAHIIYVLHVGNVVAAKSDRIIVDLRPLPFVVHMVMCNPHSRSIRPVVPIGRQMYNLIQ